MSIISGINRFLSKLGGKKYYIKTSYEMFAPILAIKQQCEIRNIKTDKVVYSIDIESMSYLNYKDGNKSPKDVAKEVLKLLETYSLDMVKLAFRSDGKWHI